MRIFLNDQYGPAHSNVAAVNLPFQRAAAEYALWRRENDPHLKSPNLNVKSGGVSGAILAVQPYYTRGVCRSAFIETVDPNWSVMIDNYILGGCDSGVRNLSRRTGTASLSVRIIPPTARLGHEVPGRDPVCSLEVNAPSAASRVLFCGFTENRWEFQEVGPPLAFEDVSRYRATRKKDRFTPDVLSSYLDSMKVPLLDASFYGNRYALVTTDTIYAGKALTLEDLRADIGFRVGADVLAW
jgi:hypothetical protein